MEIGFKCSGALDYAFRNNVIHRDIKPGNILRTAQTQVKISDFGVALIRSAAQTQITDAGSPYYASPEQAVGLELSHQSDMFSLAVELYEMLAGKRPFTDSEKFIALSERCQRRFVKALLRTLADRLALSNARIARMG